MALSDVSNILWRERRLLEQLAFARDDAQPRPDAGVFDEVKYLELERSVLLADRTHELGLSDSPTLRELAGRTSAPWSGIFAAHRRALLTLRATLSGQSIQFLRGQSARSQSTSNGLTMKQDASRVEDAESTAARAIPPSLIDFLK